MPTRDLVAAGPESVLDIKCLDCQWLQRCSGLALGQHDDIRFNRECVLLSKEIANYATAWAQRSGCLVQ